MRKAILVMDMPDNCYKCDLHVTHHNCEDVCLKNDKYIEVNIFERKPNWCPLREVPQKKMIENVKEDYDGGYSHGFTHGYNACIDEILKGEQNE